MRLKVYPVVFIFLMFMGVHIAYGTGNDQVVIAKYNNKEKITLNDLNRIISYYDAEKQKILAQKPEYKLTILKRLVEGKVISGIARKKGFDKLPEIKEQLNMLVDDFLARMYLLDITKDIKVTDEDIKQYYNANKGKFKIPERVKASHILIKVSQDATEQVREQAKKRISDILRRLKKGEGFKKLAKEYSEDKGSKDKGGDLGYFTRGRLAKAFEDAAFSLKPGEISGIVKTKFGYHIIKVLDKKPATIQPLEKVRGSIKKELFNDFRKAKIREFMNKAMKNAGVVFYPDKLIPQKKLMPQK